MSDRRSVVNIARRVQSRHSYPFSLLIISGQISLKQRNEQVDNRYMFYLLMTQQVKCNSLGGELGGRWHHPSFVPICSIQNKLAMTCRIGDHPLPESMLTKISHAMWHHPSLGHHKLTYGGREKNGRHFADNIFKCIFLDENVWISIKISLRV